MNERVVLNSPALVIERSSFLIHKELEVQASELAFLVLVPAIHQHLPRPCRLLRYSLSNWDFRLVDEAKALETASVLNDLLRHMNGGVCGHLLRS